MPRFGEAFFLKTSGRDPLTLRKPGIRNDKRTGALPGNVGKAPVCFSVCLIVAGYKKLRERSAAKSQPLKERTPSRASKNSASAPGPT